MSIGKNTCTNNTHLDHLGEKKKKKELFELVFLFTVVPLPIQGFYEKIRSLKVGGLPKKIH